MQRIALIIAPVIASAVAGGLGWVSRDPFAAPASSVELRPEGAVSEEHSPVDGDLSDESAPGNQAAGKMPGEQLSGEALLKYRTDAAESAIRGLLAKIPEAERRARAGEPGQLRELAERVQEMSSRDEEAFAAACTRILPSIESFPPAAAAFVARVIAWLPTDRSGVLASLLESRGGHKLQSVQTYAIEESLRRINLDPLFRADHRLRIAMTRLPSPASRRWLDGVEARAKLNSVASR